MSTHLLSTGKLPFRLESFLRFFFHFVAIRGHVEWEDLHGGDRAGREPFVKYCVADPVQLLAVLSCLVVALCILRAGTRWRRKRDTVMPLICAGLTDCTHDTESILSSWSRPDVRGTAFPFKTHFRKHRASTADVCRIWFG